MTVKNRFVRSATQDYLGNPDGALLPKSKWICTGYWLQTSLGLIITAHSFVQHPLGRASINQNAIYSDHFIPGYRRLAEIVQAEGAKLSCPDFPRWPPDTP